MIPGRTFLLAVLTAFVLGSPAPVRAWELVDTGLEPVPLPISGSPVIPSVQADLDGQRGSETLALKNGRLEIRSGDVVRWESPENWQVRQAAFADLNRDGRLEAVLLVWRPFKPWPVDAWLPSGGQIDDFHDSSGMSCHIILIGWYQDTFRERWAGSALAEPVKSFAVSNLGESDEPFLVTLESDYNDPSLAPARRLKVWEWNGFGFTVVSTMEGSFPRMSLVRAENGQILILTP